MAIFQAVVPVTLPSGELADFSFFSTSTDLSTAAGGVDAWYVSLAGSTPFKGRWDSGTVFGAGKLSEINMTTGKVVTSVAVGTAFAGTGIDDPLPPQVAVCVSVNTAILSRTTRGRFYLPAVMTNQVTSTGRMTSACQTDILEALADAFTAMSASDTDLIVYSRKDRDYQAATTIDVGDVFDTMRTRRDKLVELRVFADAF